MTSLKRVLVVEDDADTRDALQLALESEGYQVLVAEHGAVALARIAQVAPDVILLDMRMPIMNGWEFAEAYRHTPGPHAPIIAITAAADPERIAQIGAVSSIAKPFSIGELLEAIERSLR